MSFQANDNIQIALIGAGGMGQGDARYATSLPGVKLVAACDIYDGRLERMKEMWGNGLYTTRDFREVLNRKDVDAVIIGTPDHWHAPISILALNAGKDVYCEKPMIHSVDEGKRVIEAQKKSGRMFQVGSQYVSSMIFDKARQLLAAGALGEVNMVEAWLDRNSAVGAWQYSIPPDATPERIDWDRFLGNAPKRPFEPVRLFRWRNYNDYGTGVAGDLFVHLLSGLHFATGSIGPNRVYATGGLRFWKDGRDAPDVMLALMDYPKTAAHPEFTFALRVNFASGGSGEKFGFRFVGSEGVMTTTMSELTLSRRPRETEPGYTIGTFPKAVQEQFLKEYHANYPEQRPSADAMRPDREESFEPPRSHNAHLEHHKNFYAAVRSRKLFLEDAVFGMRTAAPALLCNMSVSKQRVYRWDPENMTAKEA
ncbi:MAG: Gfo/Idh/MocA family oxidoreductase [Bryobacteraceae bacterium]|nr:Gfo/Idh/MocA family oxidoreductase [Bryobacterales bacterium]NUN01885.1 Gfo/Idh/MocA family oxidoreductase [Bryobacteraceae bacterium]